MRRKSSRSSTKSAAHEGQRKSRRQSRRHKKSSSRSSSEDSEEKPIEQVPVEKVDEASCALNIEVEPEQPIWKVTPSSTPSGEIQKLKFCLTRPLMSPDKDKPDRRRRNKSGDQTDEEITSPSEKMPRKSRHRGSSGDNEHEEERDSQENRKGKGKSKTKHKSKCEKTPQIQDIEDNSQSDIITNVQVTPQSPQASIDTRVDTECLSTIESETVTDETEEHVSYQNENSMDDCGITSRSIEIAKGEQSYRENESSTPPPILEKHIENFQTNVSDFEEFCRNIEAPILTMAEHFEQSVKEDIVKIEADHVKKEIKVEHSLKSEEGEEEMDIEPPPLEVTIPETLHAIQETIHILRTVIETAEEGLRKENIKAEDEPVEEIQSVANDSDNSLEAPEPIHCENVTSPVDNNGSEVINESLNETMEVDKINSDEESISRDTTMDASTTLVIDNSFEITQSFSPDIQQLQEVNEELQNMKEQTNKLLQTSTPLTRKWGKSSVGLELMKPVLHKIDINTIKEFCPTLQFLDESEIKIDVRERKSSYSHEREKRKISIDYKSDDGDYKRIEKQNSVNSLEMEEIAESENDNSNIIAMNRKISIVDDTASKLKPPPSPAKNPTSEILYITNLVRPFTLKQLKELLERTGKIRENGFWTDRIKSKCYAYYESVDQAEVTRNALHGVNWPIGNGKKLIIEYATEEDLEKAKNPTPPPAVPQPLPPVPEETKTTKDAISEVSTKNNKMEEPSKVSKERQRHRSEGHIREWDIGKENVHKTRHRNKEFDSHENKNDRHKRRRTPTPSDDFISRKAQKKEEELPQKLMDDLFRKTKTTPSIYWLPLTPEEIATKQQQRLLRMAEHKRRMEESSRGRGDYGRGAPYRRRYD